MFKTGDKVMALGDQWMPAGSIGVVKSLKSQESVYVRWLKSSKQVPRSLYHRGSNLTHYDGESVNPNIAYAMKLRKHKWK